MLETTTMGAAYFVAVVAVSKLSGVLPAIFPFSFSYGAQKNERLHE